MPKRARKPWAWARFGHGPVSHRAQYTDEFFEEMRSLIESGFRLPEAIDHVRAAPWAPEFLRAGGDTRSQLNRVRPALVRRGIPTVPDPLARFWFHTEWGYQRERDMSVVECCIEWIGPTGADGYGIHAGTRPHRWIYGHVHGVVLPGMHVHHRCGRKLCVNPAHLEILPCGVHAQITALELTAGGTTCRRGHERSEFGVQYGNDWRCRACTRLRLLRRKLTSIQSEIDLLSRQETRGRRA